MISTDDCIRWLGRIDPDGYGRKGEGMAHRFVYEQSVGPIPIGLQIDHLCRVRNCVNPDHLEPVTPAENMRRAREAREPMTHCRKGHEFTERNAYRTPDGQRRCRACNLEAVRRYKLKARDLA